MVQFLVGAGRNLAHTDVYGRTALHWALGPYASSERKTRDLLEDLGTATVADVYGQTTLHVEARHSNLDIVGCESLS